MCSPVGVDKGEGEWAGVSLWRSQGHNREKATQCSWFGIGSSGGGGMRSGAALMSACVGGASGARPPAFCGAGCGERQEARAPPRPPPRDDHAPVVYYLISSTPLLASHARLAHTGRLGRCPNDRRAGARGFKVCLCLFAATPNPRASVRVRRASPHAGEARAAPQPSHLPPREGGKRAVRRHACACVETDLRNQG